MTKNMRTPAPPVAPKLPVTDTRHAIERVDKYAWLRADNWQEVMRDPSVLDADIRTYLEAENAFTVATMADTDKFQEVLFEEMKGRIKEDDSSVPAPDGPFSYYTRYITGGQHPLFCRCLIEGGDDKEIAKVQSSLGLADVPHIAESYAYLVAEKQKKAQL